jgi:hypothetical protein
VAHPDPATPSRSLVRRRLAVRVLLAAAVVGVIYFRLLPKQVDVAEVWATPGVATWTAGRPRPPMQSQSGVLQAPPGYESIERCSSGCSPVRNQPICRGSWLLPQAAVGPCSWWCRLNASWEFMLHD